ncbi:hypothetical protein Glove_108g37 [Diversispora epigaea]|uniref:SAM domain-containing protein n=1 Tax=Diversispora epigaea TaxID=1348612 RepID=A0A397J2S8_9GLOM|nr:hypothetical protein Glove_108g37 [Diversispora epigaea]
MTSVTIKDFYAITPVHKWTCANLVDYYHKENIFELSKVLDSVKKDLQKVADIEFGFDVKRRMKAQELLNHWKDWTAPMKKVRKPNKAYKKIRAVRVKQQLHAVKNSADQVDILQKQFADDSQKRSFENDEQMDEEALAKKARIEVEVEDTNNKNLVCGNNDKRTLTLPLSSAEDNSIEEIIKKDTVKLIDFLREQNLFLNNKHLEILHEREIAGCDFLKMDKQDFRECGLEIGPAMRLAGLAKKLNDQNEDSSNEFKNSTVETPPTVAELDIKLLSDNLNKIIRGEFQNIKGDIEKIRRQVEKIDNAVKSLEQRNDVEGSELS